ncbi:MAG: HAD family hydrolase [Christensenellales bacterium]
MENGIRFDLEYETMPWHRVDAVVFDIGNILIRYAPNDFLKQLFPGDEQKQRDMMARVYRGPFWENFDRGTMEYADAAQKLVERFGGEYEDYMRALTGWIELKTPIDEGFRAARRCRRAGKRLYLLSNYPREGYRRMREKFADEFGDLFDGGVISSACHFVKPERKSMKS